MHDYLWYAASLGLALWTAFAGRRMKPALERASYVAVLVALPVIYLGFAAYDGSRAAWVSELAGLALFGTLAALGAAVSPWFLVVGIAAHIPWDFAHHPGLIRTAHPRWYPVACLIYDGLIAAYVATRVGAWRRSAPEGARA